MKTLVLNFFSVRNNLVLLVGLGMLWFSSGCNKKCSSLESSISGKVIGLYDFRECFIYAQFDSTLLITSDTAFATYRNAHFKNCTATLDAVDFNKNCLIGYKVKVVACNVAFHRNIEIDSVKHEYRYTVTTEKCAGCGTDIVSTNIVLAPQVPAGYKVIYATKEK